MDKPERTPTPWKLIGMKNTTRVMAWDGENHTLIAVVNAPRPMYYDKPTTGSLNADFIVTACNAHDQLVTALKNLNQVQDGGYCICPAQDSNAQFHLHSTACNDAMLALRSVREVA